ncbi:14063_t:CDS:2, partial [Gigaspora margarita]
GFILLIMLLDFTINVGIVGGRFRHWLVVDSSLVVQLLDFAASVAANVAIA